MRITKLGHQSFKRALTTRELESYTRLLSDSKRELDIKDTTVVVFDFNVPSPKGENTGIGTTWSQNGFAFIQFLKQMTGITSVQLQPQGKISIGNVSPYSGSNYALGMHIIDLKSLEEEGLLPKGYNKKLDENYIGNNDDREYRTNYSYLLPNQEIALRKAYRKFISLESDSALKKEFKEFKDSNNSWLEREAIYQTLANYYKTEDLSLWSEVDRELYNPNYDETLRQKRLAQIQKEQKAELEYQKFVQFIAYRQQKQAKDKYNSMGIKIYGDRLVGFSQSEMWANKDCFSRNQYYGTPDVCWGVGAPDYDKVGYCDGKDTSKLGETGKLFYNLFCSYFRKYDGIRIDAAFQFMNPIIYDENNNRLDVQGLDFTLFNIIKCAAKDTLKDKFDENNIDNIIMEFAGRLAHDAKQKTKNQYPQLFATLWERNCQGVKAYRDEGYDENMMYVGLGSHDDDTLVSKARDMGFREQQFWNLHNDYPEGLNEENLKFQNHDYRNIDPQSQREEDFRTAKFSEIFASKKQYFTLVDAFGMGERINLDNQVASTNWKVRIPGDYERFYYSQLSNGYGLNMPKVLANAMRFKGINNQSLIKKLEEVAEILRQKGPNTTKEADSMQDKLGHTFEYSA